MSSSASASASALPFPFSTATFTHHHNHREFSSSLLPISASPLNASEQCTSGAYPVLRHDEQQKSPPKAKTIRYRLSQLCREGQINLACQLFDEIPQPTTVLWNTIIIGFICNDMPDEAVMFYSRMKRSGLSYSCDSYTYSSALKACAETKRLMIGKSVHAHIIRSDIHPSRIVYNSLLNMYATCLSSEKHRDHDLVERVFNTMRNRNVVAWNTMFSWYTKTERFLEAVRHFVMMLKMGVKPTVISFVNIFPSISALGDIRLADVLYGILVKLGSDYVNNMYVVSAAILMYAELGCLDTAKSIFDSSFDRNIEIWNSMITAYVQNNYPLEALHLFLDALEAEDVPSFDDVTFLSMLTAASQLCHLKCTQQLHSYLIKSSLVSHVILQNSMIATYSRCNCIGDSFKVFIQMKERDVVSWNTMLSAFVQNGHDVEGLMLIYEMQKQGFAIDFITLTALLSAASNLRDEQIGKQTHAYLLRHNIQFEGMESYLIDMYAKSSMIKAAQTIFEISSPNNRDQVTWNTMIAGNTQNGLIEQAFIVFRQMVEQNMAPNAVTLASILPACSQLGGITAGKQLHGFAIRNFLDKNVFVSSALVDMYAKSGEILYAEGVFLSSCEKNSVTYTNMILGYGQHGMGEKALELFYSLPDQGVKPDAITFVAVLSACSYSGLVEEGLQIFELMDKEYGIQPSLEHYACIVDLLGRVGRVVEAYRFLQGLGEEGNMLGMWGSLLAACRIHRNFDLAKVVANKLLELEGGDRMTGYHVLLSNIYAEEGNWEFVNGVRGGLRERGFVKEVGCSWIDISGYTCGFVSRDRRHPNCNEIYEMLDNLFINMKDIGYRCQLDAI
nr:pentatricopeptide repeat-containing protein At3g22150, chloroplastic [Ipomoea batatas]